jgi:hypothetical protein
LLLADEWNITHACVGVACGPMRNRKMTQLMSKQSFYNHKLAMHAPGSDLNIMTIAPRRALEFMKQSSHGG